MRTLVKWIGRGALALLVLLVVAAGVVYAVSERQINATYDVPLHAAGEIPADSALIAEGERLARSRGCYNGCHGEAAEGGLFIDEPLLGSVTAPDLTRVAHSLSDEELVRVIRHGVRADGRSVFIMPSAHFYHLTDRDLHAIIAFLRSLPPSGGPEASVRIGPLGRVLFAVGEFRPAAALIDHGAPRVDPGDGSDPIALGRYVATTACAECHGSAFEGSAGPPEATPNLRITSSYTPEEFHRLMRTGTPRDGRDLRLMDDMSRKRFSYLTDGEIEALYTFLTRGLAGAAD